MTFRAATITKLSTLADMIGSAAAPAMYFDDPIYGEEILRILRSEKHVVTAALYSSDDSLFTAYYRDPLQKNSPLPRNRKEGYRFSGKHLLFFRSIFYDGEPLGAVFLKYEISEMLSRFSQYLATILIVLLASFFIGYFISTRMQRVIAGPILHLAQIAGTVSRERNYSIRADTGWPEDEVGRLVADFNQMLAVIEERDHNLEKLVAERTRMLWEAVAELRKLDELKTDFYTMVSHELRTPLTSIIGFTKVIKKRLVEKIIPRIGDSDETLITSLENMREDIAIILLEGERLTTLINNALDLMMMEEGAIIWKEEQFIPAEIIERAAGTLLPLMREKGIALHMDVGDGYPAVFGDKDRFTQVMINLLANAVRFTSRGSVTCRLRRNNHEAVISVIDTGSGIAQGEHERLFNKFQQSRESDAGGYKGGRGLGLVICKRIVEHHRGRIWFESEAGRGSTFSFTIPFSGE